MKILSCITDNTVRALLNKANELGLQRSDIVNIFPLGGQIYMIYYK